MTIIVKQFGFTPASGALANIVDDNVSTGWAPVATDFAAYNYPFLKSDGNVNVQPFPALEFDYGEEVRLPMFLLQTETGVTLGDAMLIGSNFGATSTADVIRDSDVFLGIYTTAQINSGHVQKTAAFASDIRKRFYRLLQHKVGSPIQDGGGTDPGGTGDEFGTNFSIYNSGAGNFHVPAYTKLVIEGWGGGASGGESAAASDGVDTTVSTYSLTAHKGAKASATVPNSGTGAGTGGTATGGNTANITGGNGDPPAPASVGTGGSGKGGDSPNGGLGGFVAVNGSFGLVSGMDGFIPGGGGSGRNLFSSVSGGSYFKYPGGGAGGYFRHEFIFGVAGSPAVADLIAYSVGAGGASTLGNGAGAHGRVKFSWS